MVLLTITGEQSGDIKILKFLIVFFLSLIIPLIIIIAYKLKNRGKNEN